MRKFHIKYLLTGKVILYGGEWRIVKRLGFLIDILWHQENEKNFSYWRVMFFEVFRILNCK